MGTLDHLALAGCDIRDLVPSSFGPNVAGRLAIGAWMLGWAALGWAVAKAELVAERHDACSGRHGLPSRTVAAEITLTLSSTVVPTTDVFRAMTDRDQVAEWWGPKFTCPEVTLDVKRAAPSGSRCSLLRASSSTSPGSTSKSDPHLAWPIPFAGNRPTPTTETMARLLRRAGATEIELTQGPFATEARRQLHEAGWTDSLARLAEHLMPGLSGRTARSGGLVVSKRGAAAARCVATCYAGPSSRPRQPRR